jgi:hypothetical protein
MSEELTKKEEEALQQLFQAVASELSEGKSKEKIVKELVKQDWPEDSAVQFVNNVEEEMNRYKESPEGRQILAQKYARHMGYGLLWAVGGTVVTAVTYSAAASSPSGGTYVVAWGAILYGVIDFFRGLFGWLKYKN